MKLCLCKYGLGACQEFLFDGKYLLCVGQQSPSPDQTVVGTAPVGGFVPLGGCWSVTADGPRIPQRTVAVMFMRWLVLIVNALCVIQCDERVSIHDAVCYSGVTVSIATAKCCVWKVLEAIFHHKTIFLCNNH